MSSRTSGDGLRVNNDLGQLAPLFRAAVERSIAECHRQGLDATVFEGYRSPELQAAYYARGRTIKPPLSPVTNAPTNLQSWHGYGLAVDVISRSKGWSGGNVWFAKVASIFKANECKWGGDWTKPDPPHFQWHRCKASPSDEARQLISSAGALAVWDAVGALGSPIDSETLVVAPATAVRIARVNASVLNLRRDPSTSQAPLLQLQRGTTIEILEPHGSWFRVRVDGAEGFVHGDMVTLLPAQETGEFLARDPALQTISLLPDQTLEVPTSGISRTVAETWNRYGGLLERLSRRLRIPTAAAVAVMCVESGGKGLVGGRLVIRFEVHRFHKSWGAKNSDVFRRHFQFNADKPWTGHLFCPGDGPFAPFHENQDTEWRVFDAACALDRTAAIESISMGLAQIMGFNYKVIGYESPNAMFDALGDERFQILGMFDFINGSGSSSPMVLALQQGNYEAFATRYNGSGQAAVYGGRIRSHAAAFDALRS